MEITVGAFNLNTLCLRYNLSSEVEQKSPPDVSRNDPFHQTSLTHQRILL